MSISDPSCSTFAGAPVSGRYHIGFLIYALFRTRGDKRRVLLMQCFIQGGHSLNLMWSCEPNGESCIRVARSPEAVNGQNGAEDDAGIVIGPI